MAIPIILPFKLGGALRCTTASGCLTAILFVLVTLNLGVIYNTNFPTRIGLFAFLGFLQLFNIVFPVLLYRLYFHPLSKYPGPFWAKCTDWYTVYHCYIGDRHLDFYRLHSTYGKVVRFGPDRISINSATALRVIYGTNSNAQKSQVHEAFVHFFKRRMSMTTIDREEHAFKRRVNIKALTSTAIKNMEDKLLKSIDVFCAKMRDGKPCDGWHSAKDISEWSALLASDIQGDITFSRNWDVLKSPENRRIVKILPEGVGGLILSGHMPAILTLKLDKILFSKLTKETYEYQALSKDQAEWRMAQGQKSTMNDIFAALESAQDPETKRMYTPLELVSEAGLLIIAGSDTTATAIAATVFYLLHNLEPLRILQEEIRSAFASLDEIRISTKLSACRYLFACFDESMRLSSPVPGLLPREILHGGLDVDGIHLPEGTDTGVPIYALHHNDEYFPHPWAFKPSRWMVGQDGTTEEDVKRARSAFAVFGYGRTSCVGKHLAYQEMALTVARMVWSYEWRLQPGSRVGEGRKGRGWGRERKDEFQLWDKFVSISEGPLVEFKIRAGAPSGH